MYKTGHRIYRNIDIKGSKTKEYASDYGWPDVAVLPSIKSFYYYQMNGLNTFHQTIFLVFVHNNIESFMFPCFVK